MANRIDHESGTSDHEFARELSDLMRQFKVTVVDEANPESGTRIEYVFAHMHDAGENAAGHLGFVTIGRDGKYRVSRLFSVHSWIELEEIVGEKGLLTC